MEEPDIEDAAKYMIFKVNITFKAFLTVELHPKLTCSRCRNTFNFPSILILTHAEIIIHFALLVKEIN